MKKTLIILLVLFTLFTLAACGEKEEYKKTLNDNNTTQKENNNEKQQEEKKDNQIIDDEIIEFDESDNPIVTNENITVTEVINCNNCVYAYFSEEKYLGSTLNEGEYTTDVNKLKTNGGKQRHNFFGLVLVDNKISRAYSCILKESKIYCIEGSTN